MDIETVRRFLSHVSLLLTSRTYVHHASRQMKGTAEAIKAIGFYIKPVTTIAYDERYQVSKESRSIAAFLTVFEVAMIGTLTGAFAAWISEQRQD